MNTGIKNKICEIEEHFSITSDIGELKDFDFKPLFDLIQTMEYSMMLFIHNSKKDNFTQDELEKTRQQFKSILGLK
jgi:hypothetical protein